jgi:hypothetical protein
VLGQERRLAQRPVAVPAQPSPAHTSGSGPPCPRPPAEPGVPDCTWDTLFAWPAPFSRASARNPARRPSRSRVVVQAVRPAEGDLAHLTPPPASRRQPRPLAYELRTVSACRRAPGSSEHLGLSTATHGGAASTTGVPRRNWLRKSRAERPCSQQGRHTDIRNVCAHALRRMTEQRIAGSARQSVALAPADAGTCTGHHAVPVGRVARPPRGPLGRDAAVAGQRPNFLAAISNVYL